MYRESDNVNENVQQEASREAVSRKHEVELDIEVLEERIAPKGVLGTEMISAGSGGTSGTERGIAVPKEQ